MNETGAVIPAGRFVVGLRLPVQAGARATAEPWERSARQRTLEAIVRKADAAGFFYLAVEDHVAVPAAASDELGTTWYDPMTTLAWIAALTQRTRVLADQFVLAYRHPLLAAKALMTLDALSQGRAIVGVSAGELEGEFQLLGISFPERDSLLDRGIDLLRAAFADEFVAVSTAGETTLSAGLAPRPPQARLPIWVAGSSPTALRRAAERGDGWMPTDTARDTFAEQLAVVRRHREDVQGPGMDIGAVAESMYLGRPSWDVGDDVLTGDGEYLAARILEFAEMGANHARIRLRSRSADELLDQLEAFGEAVVPLLDPSGQRSARYEEPAFEEIARFSRLQVQAMETSAGDDDNVWGAIGNDLLLLSTRGRRTGREHKVALAFWRDSQGTPIVVGSYAGAPQHPDWYLNLADRSTNPRVSVRFRNRVYTAVAEELRGTEYDEVWGQLTLDRPSYRNYSTRTDRRFALVRLVEDEAGVEPPIDS